MNGSVAPVRILYVDDYAFDRELVRDTLERDHEGFQLSLATSRAEFQTQLSERDFDLVLSDFNILGFEGFQVLEAVKLKTPAVPVIIVTGTGSEEIAVEAMKRGAADYVIKTPQHIRRLPQTIRNCLQQAKLELRNQRNTQALRESEAALRKISAIHAGMLNALPAQVALLDHRGTILSVNQGWRLMAAASGESRHLFQAEGTNYVTACDLLRGDLASEAVTLSRGLRSVLSGASETFSLEYRAPPPMQTRWFRLMVVPLVTSGERQIVVMHVDITERKLMELKLHSAMDAANEANRLKSEFLANISHEIRTPMTSILGYTDLLLHQLHEDISVSLPVALQTIQRNGEHMLQIINDLLDLSKIEAGKFLLDRIACSPFEILDDVRALMSVRAKGRGLELTFRQNGSLPEKILTDPVRLRQVLINLVGNAIKFTSQGSVTVESTLVQPADAAPHLRFAVIDTGMGIDPAKVPHIFEPFSQADSSSVRNHGGTGLGLAICQRLAAMLGGEIQVNSVPGQGSRFVFTTLTGDLEGVALLEHNRTLHAQAPLAGMPRKTLHGRVLLVEDGSDNQRFLSVVLRNAGADVAIAPNGQAACDTVLESRASGRPFDLILMDMQMPVRDGYSATTEIRQGGFRNPIIALTAHAMTDDRERCLRAGCDDYATKPIQKHALMELVGKWLERGLEREQALAISGSKGSPTTSGGIHPLKSAPGGDSADK